MQDRQAACDRISMLSQIAVLKGEERDVKWGHVNTRALADIF